MTEVLYTMRNGKIVDPNIPTDGLICYLDARGKTNNDIYKNVLLDLSGNGNHGELQNFNFTEESGYVKSSDLRFDGVDDFLEKSYTSVDNYTLLLDFEHFRAETNDFIIDTGKLLFYYWSSTGNYTLRCVKQDGSHAYIDLTKQDLAGNRLIISVSETSGKLITRNKSVSINDITKGFDGISIAKKTLSWGSFGKIDFRKLAIWNRALTDAEIQQLLTA